MRIAIAALFVLGTFGTGCLDNDQPTDDQTQEKDNPDDSNTGAGVGDPGNEAPNAAFNDDSGLYRNAGDPQTSPGQTCHERIKGTHTCL